MSVFKQPFVIFFIILVLVYIVDCLPNVENEFIDSIFFHIVLLVTTLYLAKHNIGLSLAILIFYLLVRETKYHKKWAKMFEKIPVDNVIKSKCKVREVEPSWTVPVVDNGIRSNKSMEAFSGCEYSKCGI